jgi:hypothetical protein
MLPDQNTPDLCVLFPELTKKLDATLGKTLAVFRTEFEGREVRIRATAIFGDLIKAHASSHHHKRIPGLCTEMFADMIISTYFAATGLGTPAQMLLRRVLELGVATVYLWDLPHEFFGWEQFDKDLNFNDMLDHITSSQYIAYVHSDRPESKGRFPINASSAKELYGSLSDTIHGKITKLSSSLPDRFGFQEEAFVQHLKNIDLIGEILIDLWSFRFPVQVGELYALLPPLYLLQ